MESIEEKLTGKQRRFADLYVGECSLNATRAAQSAGYAGDDNSLAAAGSRLLRNVKVRTYIDSQLKDLIASPNEILTILTKHAKGSLADVLDGSGDFNFADAKRRGVDSLLKKLKVKKIYDPVLKETETTYEYEIYDAQSAAVHLGKVHKLFTDRTEVTGKDGGPIQTSQMSLEEWRQAAAERRVEAAETSEKFNELTKPPSGEDDVQN